MRHFTARPSSLQRQQRLEREGVPPLLARLYAARGVHAASELCYDAKFLLPPEALTHGRAAARLLADALAANARLMIVADYDCDGATACAVGIRALRGMIRANPACRASVEYLVPDRFILGYGLSPAIVDLAAQHSPDLIITVDNGIASLEGVARARQLGIATLITDHHLPGEKLPEADCIVNPNQPGCGFPSKHLAGVGVMFYVLIALRAELRERGWFAAGKEPNLAAFLDLVALGTVADVVPLDHNNRILVSNGLARMRAGRLLPGLSALLAAAGRRAERISIFDLGFVIGPRINAAGRLADMRVGIECLLADDPARALQLARQLDGLNRERREIEAVMQEQALVLLERFDGEDMAPGLAIFDADWHQGVVGILASRLKERIHRPVFAFARGEGGLIKGSGRSIPGLHLRDALDLLSKRAPGLLLSFGGHAAAAGVTLREEDFPRFHGHFADIAAELLSPEDLTHSLTTDGSLESAYYNLPTARLLNEQIWGQGFPAPLFADEFTIEQERALKEKHLKLRLARGNSRFDAIWFNCLDNPDPSAPPPIPARSRRFAYHLDLNEYQGVESVQLVIEGEGRGQETVS
ncbi:MAG: single-stranded-DNA-specific exonuclease RecJ [Zoogloeaceae bacterium]|jgi:single-stranded-DNA-specific exonuclease|nr:single-stranded-DNA-specific exonuclease RecJ [Zoogloeaceae bacterium]